MRWVVSPTPHVRDLRMEFLTKLFFLRHLGIKGGRELIDAQAELLKSLKEKVEQDWGAQEDGFAKVVLGFKRAQFEIALNWLGTDVARFIGEIDAAGAGGVPGIVPEHPGIRYCARPGSVRRSARPARRALTGCRVYRAQGKPVPPAG